MRRSTLTLIAALMAAHAGAVHAGQVEKLPPSGKAKFQVSYVQWDSNDVDMNGRAGFGNFKFGGITRNLDGKSWFDLVGLLAAPLVLAVTRPRAQVSGVSSDPAPSPS